MNSKWSDSLNKTEIDDWIIDELEEDSEVEIPQALLSNLKQKIQNSNDIKNLEKTIKDLSKYVSEDTIEPLLDELEEIKEDFECSETDKGKSTLVINDWTQLFHNEFRDIKEFDDVFIGAHTEKNVVFVCGKVKNREIKEKLESYVKSKEPPLDLLFKIEIST